MKSDCGAVVQDFELDTDQIPFEIEALLLSDFPLTSEHQKEINNVLDPIVDEHLEQYRDKFYGMIFEIGYGAGGVIN